MGFVVGPLGVAVGVVGPVGLEIRTRREWTARNITQTSGNAPRGVNANGQTDR